MKPSRPRRSKLCLEMSHTTETKSRDSITAEHTLKLRNEDMKFLAFLALFTKPQVVLTCCGRFQQSVTSRAVGVRESGRISGAKPRKI